MLFVRDLWYVCACVYESSEASAYSFGLATNPNPTRARSYPLNINPKLNPKPESISGPAGSGRVADLYLRHASKVALSDLLDLINLHCPDSTNGVPDSLYKFIKSFHWDTFEVQYICPSWQYFFGKEIRTHCASCDGTPGDIENLIKSGSVFIKLSISDQIRGTSQNADFCQSLDYEW